MKTAACIATIESRKETLHKTIESLRKQVDQVFVMVNDYSFQSEHDDVLCINMRADEKGDASKFFVYCMTPNAYDVWFFCDDDLIYRSDYVQKALEKLKEYPDAILSFHGRTIKKRPIESYYRHSRKESFHCLRTLTQDFKVDPDGTLGTGVMFFRNLNLDWHEDLTEKNMADILIAKRAIEQGKQMIVCAHEEGIVKHQETESTIFERYQFDDEIQTKIYNSIKKV